MSHWENVRHVRRVWPTAFLIFAAVASLVSASASLPPLCLSVGPCSPFTAERGVSAGLLLLHGVLVGSPVVLRIKDVLSGFAGSCLSHPADFSASPAACSPLLCSGQTDEFRPGSPWYLLCALSLCRSSFFSLKWPRHLCYSSWKPPPVFLMLTHPSDSGIPCGLSLPTPCVHKCCSSFAQTLGPDHLGLTLSSAFCWSCHRGHIIEHLTISFSSSWKWEDNYMRLTVFLRGWKEPVPAQHLKEHLACVKCREMVGYHCGLWLHSYPHHELWGLKTVPVSSEALAWGRLFNIGRMNEEKHLRLCF